MLASGWPLRPYAWLAARSTRRPWTQTPPCGRRPRRSLRRIRAAPGTISPAKNTGFVATPAAGSWRERSVRRSARASTSPAFRARPRTPSSVATWPPALGRRAPTPRSKVPGVGPAPICNSGRAQPVAQRSEAHTRIGTAGSRITPSTRIAWWSRLAAAASGVTRPAKGCSHTCARATAVLRIPRRPTLVSVAAASPTRTATVTVRPTATMLVRSIRARSRPVSAAAETSTATSTATALRIASTRATKIKAAPWRRARLTSRAATRRSRAANTSSATAPRAGGGPRPSAKPWGCASRGSRARRRTRSSGNTS